MNKIITYIVLIFIGIVLYLLWNTYEQFNIGAIPWVYLNKSNHENLINNHSLVEAIPVQEEDARDSGYYQEIQVPRFNSGPWSDQSIRRKIGYLIDSELSKSSPTLNFTTDDMDDNIKPNCPIGDDTSECYYRKINPTNASNSEFKIDVFNQRIISETTKFMDDDVTGEQYRKFDALFDYSAVEPEYKLFAIDNLSLLKIYSMLNKYYIENKGEQNNIPQPILYFSCHAQYLQEPPISVDLRYVDRDLKFHQVVPTTRYGAIGNPHFQAEHAGCSIQYIVNLNNPDHNFNQSNPKNTQGPRTRGMPSNYYKTRYQIPLHYRENEFIAARHNAFFDCNVCYMVILYKNEDGDYYQYSSSTLRNMGEKYKNLNLMRMFGLTTTVRYDDSTDNQQTKEIPIMFKSYNFDTTEKFPPNKYYDVNTLWNAIIEKILNTFPESIRVTEVYELINPGDSIDSVPVHVPVTLSNYPLKLFVDACVEADKEKNIRNRCKFLEMVKEIEGDDVMGDGNYDVVWDLANLGQIRPQLAEDVKDCSMRKRPPSHDDDDDDVPEKRSRHCSTYSSISMKV